MDTQENLASRQQLVFYLMDKGLSNDEVAQVLADVAEAALEEFTNEAMNLLSDEDKKAIEEAQSRSEFDADELVKNLYETKSGNNSDKRLEELIDVHAASYMSDGSGNTVHSAVSQ